jgi:uncharacterized YccA/Bax inhibitor family protein
MYTSLCTEDTCKSTSITKDVLSTILTFSLPIVGILNSIRTAVVYKLNDPDNIPENLFYSSLIGFSLFYLILGIFNSHYIGLVEKTTLSKSFWLIGIIIFAISFVFVLADRMTWHKAPNFIKWRLALTIIHQTSFIMSIYLGLMFSIFIFPLAMLVNADYPKDFKR